MLITLHGYDNSADNGIDPLMKGYDFTNRIKSSMLFEADSEIALVNATIERILEYTVTSNTNKLELDTDEIGGTILLTIPIGNYTPQALQVAIQTGLDTANTFGYRFMIAARVVTGDGELLGYTPQLARVKVLLFLMLMSRSIALQELVGLVERGLGRIRLVLLVLLLTLLLRSIPVLITGLGAHHLTGVSIPTSLRSRLIW